MLECCRQIMSRLVHWEMGFLEGKINQRECQLSYCQVLLSSPITILLFVCSLSSQFPLACSVLVLTMRKFAVKSQPYVLCFRLTCLFVLVLKKKLSAQEVQELVRGERNVPLIIDFYATWCGPCNLMAQELEMVGSSLHPVNQSCSSILIQCVVSLPFFFFFSRIDGSSLVIWFWWVCAS